MNITDEPSAITALSPVKSPSVNGEINQFTIATEIEIIIPKRKVFSTLRYAKS